MSAPPGTRKKPYAWPSDGLRMRWASLLVLCLAAAALAGCSSKTPAVSGSDAPGVSVQAGSNTGAIRGVVVDAGIHPIANASVTASGGGKVLKTTTNAQGGFGFSQLTPGAYFVHATKLGYQGSQTSVEVAAGVAAPPVTRIQIQADPGSTPSVDVFHFQGYIECNLVAGPFFSPCEAPGVGEVPGDDYTRSYNVTGNVSFVQSTLVWTATYPGAEELYQNVYTGDYNIIGYAGGPSPLVVNITKDAGAFSNTYLAVEISSNGVQGTAGGAIEQSFDDYIVVTHNFVPPPGYSFLRDGAPRIPQ